MQETLAAWRAEVEIDLEKARTELAAAVNAIAEAEVEVLIAKRERHALSDAVARLGTLPTLSGALHWRVHQHGLALAQPDGNLVRAKNEMKNCRARVADLETALEQIARMAPPAEVEQAA